MPKITGFVIDSFIFTLPQKVKDLFTVPGEKQLNFGCKLEAGIDANAGFMSLKTVMFIESVEVFSVAHFLRLEGMTPTTSLKDIVEDKECMAFILRVFCSMLNHVNSMLIATPVGPIPLHAYNLQEQIRHIAQQQVVAPAAATISPVR